MCALGEIFLLSYFMRSIIQNLPMHLNITVFVIIRALF